MTADNTGAPAPTFDEMLTQPGRLLELESADSRAAEALWHGLSQAERLRVVLAARGKQRERLITLAADSAALTQALAVDEFAATALELGPDDAGALIELSSDEQLTYLLDLTGWQAERFAPARYEAWLPLIVQAGPERMLRWLASTDLEVLSLLMGHWVRVAKWLPSQDEQEPPDDLPEFTLDGVYYIDFPRAEERDLLVQVLTALRSEQPQRFREVMEAMLWEGAANLAEQADRWRAGRLADHGFPGRLEALELWARPAPDERDWRGLPEKDALGFMAEAPARSDAVLEMLPPGGGLPALAGRLSGRAREMLKAELVYIANCGAMALDADPADPEAVARAAQESLGLVNLGLAVLSNGDEAEAAAIVARLPLAALARRGALQVRQLNRRAWELMREGWLAGLPTGLHVLEPPLDRWLAGLLYPRPRCYDPGLDQGREYRAFRDTADLRAADDAVTRAEYWGRLLFDLMGMDKAQAAALLRARAWPEDPQEVKVTHLVGTWLARRLLGLEGLAPLPADRLGQAVAALQQGLAGGLDDELKRSVAALGQVEDPALAGRMLAEALERLRQELGGLVVGDEPIEPQFVAGLVVER